jgi:hypothetical protein
MAFEVELMKLMLGDHLLAFCLVHWFAEDTFNTAAPEQPSS